MLVYLVIFDACIFDNFKTVFYLDSVVCLGKINCSRSGQYSCHQRSSLSTSTRVQTALSGPGNEWFGKRKQIHYGS